jgi:guanosine-3',5'-bis(diphosphate) 3'-pyrophosphohydrolase
MEEDAVRAVLRALSFASERHSDQRRKGADRPPFINHAIEVAAILATVGAVTDAVTLQAAVLHDTLEDTSTSAAELQAVFGRDVRQVVEEVTDDIRLPRADRKRRQIESAPQLSSRAKLIRLADKISNVRAVAEAPPIDWSLDRRLDYVTWSERVIAGCRGCSATLERAYDEVLRDALRTLGELTA